MSTFTYRRTLPSCLLNRGLLVNIEKRLLNGIPRLLQKGLRKIVNGLGLESYKKLENYQLVIETRKETQRLTSAGEMATPYFEAGTRQVRVTYRLGGPKIIVLEVVFPQSGRPWIELSTESPQIDTALPKIADGICDAVASHGNRYRLLHNNVIQGLLMLLVPAMVMTYGLLNRFDPFLLYACMGWLCLLLLGLTSTLPQVFPWVTFQTRQRFQWRRLPLLAKVSVLTVAICVYIGLVLLSLPSAQAPAAILLAGIIG